MTDLSSYANSKLPHPDKAWRPGAVFNGQEATVVTKPYETDQDHDEVMLEAGYDPEHWELVGPMNYSRRELDSGEIRISYRFRAQKRRGSIELTTMIHEVEKAIQPKDSIVDDIEVRENRALCVVWADPQTGKSASRGGSKELTGRIFTIREKLRVEALRRRCGSAFFFDAGDGIEGFENVAGQQFTNDLSLMDQIDLEATFEAKYIETLLDTHLSVTAAGVPSNHTGWRKGKGLLGKPSDDWGLFIKRQLKKEFSRSDDYASRLTFYEPDEFDESLTIDVLGTGVGLTHGHQAGNENGVLRMWADHVHGAQPLAYADVLLTGHFHHFRMQPSGRSMRTGRSKWWIQAPTLDNGSDWYRNIKGDDSDPGLVIFEIDAETGFDFASLSILSS